MVEWGGKYFYDFGWRRFRESSFYIKLGRVYFKLEASIKIYWKYAADVD